MYMYIVIVNRLLKVLVQLIGQLCCISCLACNIYCHVAIYGAPLGVGIGLLGTFLFSSMVTTVTSYR